VTEDRPLGWPSDVDPINIEDLGRLGINTDKELFWDGKRVEVRHRLILTRLQKMGAVVVAICAILGGLGGFITGFNNATVFLCARHITVLTCPDNP
jgi:hypothetical protein